MLNARVQAAELKQKMLQLQMSPHFIFNAMQSLGNRISAGELSAARQQLSSVSKIMRSMLNMSRQELVSLEDELEFLNAYVDVERALSDKDLILEISTGMDVEPFGEMLPSMMLQPLIENAIKHGGPHIVLDIQRLGKCLSVTVTDNGEGFADLDHRSVDSVALKVLEERISGMRGSSVRFSNSPEGGARVELNLCN